MNQPIKSGNFSLAFEQMCNFAAIAKTQDADETLRQLIQLCLVILPDEKFQSASQIMEAMTLFGLQFPEYQVQSGLDRLIAQGGIQQPSNTYLTVPDKDRTQLKKRIDEVKALEERVKQEWLGEVSTRFPTLSPQQAWQALQGHLASTFRNHGIQTIALLDPTIYTPPEQVENLASLLNDAIQETFTPEQQATAREAISSFLETVGDHPERAKYIAQLGDGVFTYFSLTVEPKVAQHFHKRLNPLTLFFDTNFLFGILNLQTPKYYEVASELLHITDKYRFPFKLRYHQATEREVRATIAFYGARLRSNRPSLNPSSIELEYHRRNAATGIDVNTFLEPYEHMDVILKSKNIHIHRLQVARQREHAYLLQEYKKFLEVRGRFRDEEMLEHDITILEAVHQLRSKAKSSLEAGTLLVTWDKFLYRFDWEISRAQGRPACVVLPDQFMQVLRPFVPSDSDFDRSFAEAFALPELRAIESRVPEAQQQLSSYLASYEPFPEEIAANLLTNGLLIDRLHTAENDEHFQKSVESALIHENTALLEEKAATLAKLLEHERAESAVKEKQLAQERIEVEQMKARAAQAEQLSRQQAKELASLKKQVGRQGSGESKQQKAQIEQALAAISREKQAREEAEKRAEQEALLRQKTEQRAHIYATVASIMFSIILITIFELLISLNPGTWFLQHRTRYGLQVAVDSLLLFITVGFFHPHRRSWFWGVGALALLGTVLQLL